jgi:hypothetical protein
VHPFLRVLILAFVALIVAGALVALAFLGRDMTLSTTALLVAGILGVLVGGFVFVQSWIWSQRTWREGRGGAAAGIALAGGLAVLVAAGALAATIVLLTTFGIG